MDKITQSSVTLAPEDLIERTEEMKDLASLLPLDGFNMRSNRVCNVWGGSAVGKSTFIASFRESDATQLKKVLWITPQSSESIDTPQEFIAACSKGIRFPKEPNREEAISKKLNESQRGKTDPLRSDDAILITRSSIATNKKPYVNTAAAASIGRTSFIREDLDLSVGFGIDQSGKQAEAFLDALPLQSMGTDLIVLYLSNSDPISQTVKDWFRDYIIPAATRGPFRRNLVVLTESNDPFECNSLEYSFGEWDEQSVDYCLLPASEERIHQHALDRGLSQFEARYVFIKSLGYPQAAREAIDAASKRSRNRETLSLASTLISTLPSEEKARLAACCLPDTLYPDELDAIFGNSKGRAVIGWLDSLPSMPLTPTPQGTSYTIPDDFRIVALDASRDDTDFVDFKNRWLSYARLMHAAPSKADRAKLYLLAGLNWIETGVCQAIFGEKTERVIEFLDTKSQYFVKHLLLIRISERLRQDLRDTATNMGHIGIVSLQKRAQALWNDRRDSLNQTLEELERSLGSLDERMLSLQNKHSQLSSQLKNIESETPPALNARAIAAAEASNHGKLIALLVTLSCVFFLVSQSRPSPIDLIAAISGTASLCICLFLVPGWKRQRLAKAIKARAEIKGSPENLRKENLEVVQQMQADENARDELKRKRTQTQEDLNYAYV